jgi:hypothetical protein
MHNQTYCKVVIKVKDKDYWWDALGLALLTKTWRLWNSNTSWTCSYWINDSGFVRMSYSVCKLYHN